MKTTVETFIELLQSSGQTLNALGFSPGASVEEINDIENKTGQKLPDSFKLFLAQINGQKNELFYFLPEQVKLFSCLEIIEEWEQQQEYAPDTLEFYDSFQDEDRIRCTIYHKTRIPIAGQEGAGFICIDNAPGPNGTTGQIIYLVNECDFIVLANSFEDLLSSLIASWQNGGLKFEKEREGYPNQFRLRSDTDDMDGYSYSTALKG